MRVIYNVVDRLREGAALTKAEQEVHRIAACGTLRDFHDELNRLMAEAYGWSWPEPPAVILKRLVALHDRRVEEAAGQVRWLRPDYQRLRFGRHGQMSADVPALGLTADEADATAPTSATLVP